MAEKRVWTDLWHTPQAAAWERLGWVRTVARYCRLSVRCEAKDASAPLIATATALEDRLGLTPKAMKLMLWVISDDELEERRTERASQTSDRQRPAAVDLGE